MSLEGDLYTAVAALYTADSGAGGLNNASSAARVRVQDYLRDDNQDDRGAGNFPKIIVNTSYTSEQDAFARGRAVIDGRFRVFNKRDYQCFPRLDAVLDRLRTVYHRASLTASSSWQWSPLLVRRIVQGPTSGNVVQRIVEFRVVATRVTGVV